MINKQIKIKILTLKERTFKLKELRKMKMELQNLFVVAMKEHLKKY